MFSPKKNLLLALAFSTMVGAAGAATAVDTDGNTTSAGQSKKAQRIQNHELAKSVRHALFKTKHLDSADIVVLARGGKITLDGTVPTVEEVQLAGTTAGTVPGVTSVTNNLTQAEPGR